MKNLKVSLKLTISFLAVAAFAALVGIIGIYGLVQMEAKDNELYDLNLVAISAMADFREAYQSERTLLRTVILETGNIDAVEKAISEFSALEQTILNAISVYESTITDNSLEDGYFSAKNTYLGDYANVKKNIFAAARDGDYTLAKQRLDDAAYVVQPIILGLQKSADLNDTWGNDTVTANSRLSSTLIVVQVAALIVAVSLALFFAFYISGLISKPLSILTDFMNKAGKTGDITLRQEDMENINNYARYKDETGLCIASTANFMQHVSSISDKLDLVAAGDLTIDIEVLSEKDIMGLAVQKMVANLNSMFSEINASTAQVSIGSKQIADGAQALAQGSTEQAASVQQLSSSISEIADKTKSNADMAGKAAELATSIMGNAEKGSRQMDEMMSAVKDINAASQSINKVIKVIDDIAFQTNILALNAAVEAARAGQHGKGFAVVAEEVRNLAAKSAEAAKETGSMIADSIEKAELGSRIADETSTSLSDIVSGINESAQLVGEIARSSEEQSIGISQINKGIDQVAQVVQQNSATAEQSAAASEQMSGQATMLESLISQFKLKNDNPARYRSLPPSNNNPSFDRIAASSKSSPAPLNNSQNEGYGKY